jgi:DnaJ like chaperone protein
MGYQGRLICTLIGMLLAGPAGAIIGYMLGNALDRRSRGSQHSGANIEQAFFKATFLFLGHLAKADGRVSQKEIAATETIMQRLYLNQEQKILARELFRKGRDQSFSYHASLNKIAPYRLTRHMQAFISSLMELAYADGDPTPNQRTVLEGICEQLGLPRSNFFDFAYRKTGQGHQRYHSQHPHNGPHFNQNPFRLLGIASNAKTSEVRKAYRRAISKSHPDKLTAKGASPEELRKATNRTQEIRAAYEQILEQRGEKKA